MACPAFKPPEARNAATTLTAMAILLGVLFVGITFVADRFGIVPIDFPTTKTVISQVARHLAYGNDTICVLPLPDLHGADPVPRREHVLQRLPTPCRDPCSRRLHAAPVQLPRRSSGLHPRDRHPGIVAIVLLVAFGGNTTALIPLYSIGVFVSFTISQFGMVIHWLHERSAGLALADRDQWPRGHPHGDRLRRRPRGEVRGRRVARRRDHPDPRRC